MKLRASGPVNQRRLPPGWGGGILRPPHNRLDGTDSTEDLHGPPEPLRPRDPGRRDGRRGVDLRRRRADRPPRAGGGGAAGAEPALLRPQPETGRPAGSEALPGRPSPGGRHAAVLELRRPHHHHRADRGHRRRVRHRPPHGDRDHRRSRRRRHLPPCPHRDLGREPGLLRLRLRLPPGSAQPRGLPPTRRGAGLFRVQRSLVLRRPRSHRRLRGGLGPPTATPTSSRSRPTARSGRCR